MAGIFAQRSLSYDVTIRARFGTTVFALVKHGLGIAVLDQFTVAETPLSGVCRIPIAEPTEFQTYFAYRKDATLSSFCEYFVAALRAEMQGKDGPARGKSALRSRPKASPPKSNIRFPIQSNLVFDVTSMERHCTPRAAFGMILQSLPISKKR